ncbi:MAG TPA: FAD-dependent oxidoreductase [Chthoniobacteraceae bacterium]|nr:FAD-dependent oxidoreductase [Chthoniobacteraceae bacterium]
MIPFVCLLLAGRVFAADQLLVEAESFEQPGGWVLDTQFIEIMGSSYLLAHGLGVPVADATTTVTFPTVGTYRVFVRTKDWVARWKAAGAPGKFQLLVGGKALAETFGSKGAQWSWDDGGAVEIVQPKIALALHDLTGFDGRCDAIFFTKDPAVTPPNDGPALADWRRATLGLPPEPRDGGSYDFVVVGGGYSGMGSAISAARMGCKVALVQDRAVLGGNGSSEVRVWAQGGIRRGLYPNLGEIVEEFADKATMSPGKQEEFGDERKEAVVRAETNISLFFNHHVISVEMREPRRSIAAVVALDVKTSEQRRFRGKLFVDCTGHGTIGFLAGAEHTTQEDGHLGMSNMWRWANADSPQTFPEVSWALDMDVEDFPYPRKGHGEWFWESGFGIHPIYGLEETRDWNLRAIFGAWNALKNKGGKADHVNGRLEWVAYIGGTRESRQLLGDVVLTREDIAEKKPFPDGTVPTTWDIDLHYPKEQYAKKFPDNPFISKAIFDKSVDREHGYPVPYRCFYSRNIENLFMAGRCISVTHEALGTVRVMKTGGMIGEVVGKAASIALKNGATPREVYERYFGELKELLALHGAARRETLDGPIRLPDGFIPPPSAPATKTTGAPGFDPAKLSGLVLDDSQAKLTGEWSGAANLQGYVGTGYRYRAAKEEGAARYEFTIPKAGRYEVRLSYGAHENRATNAPVSIESAEGHSAVTVNQRVAPPLPQGFVSVGVFRFEPGKPATVSIGGASADGNVHADAVQLIPIP